MPAFNYLHHIAKGLNICLRGNNPDVFGRAHPQSVLVSVDSANTNQVMRIKGEGISYLQLCHSILKCLLRETM